MLKFTRPWEFQNLEWGEKRRWPVATTVVNVKYLDLLKTLIYRLPRVAVLRIPETRDTVIVKTVQAAAQKIRVRILPVGVRRAAPYVDKSLKRTKAGEQPGSARIREVPIPGDFFVTPPRG